MQTVLRVSVAAILLLAAAKASAQTSQPAPVEQWGLFEQRLDGPRDGNPFVDAQLSAKFTNAADHKTVNVEGFYDGDGAYLIRFMPEEQGNWHFETTSNRPKLNGKTGDFTCSAPAEGNHGPVRVAYTYHFAYADGTPFVAIGTTCYAWWNQPEKIEETTLASLKASPFNKVRANVITGNANALCYPYAQSADGKFSIPCVSTRNSSTTSSTASTTSAPSASKPNRSSSTPTKKESSPSSTAWTTPAMTATSPTSSIASPPAATSGGP